MSGIKNIFRSDLIRRISLAVLILASASSAAVSTFAFASASSLLRLGDFTVSTLAPASIKLGLRNPSTGIIDYYDQLTADAFEASNQEAPVSRALYPVSSSFLDKWLIKGTDGTYDSVTPHFTLNYPNNANVGFPGFAGTADYISMEIYLTEENTESLPVNIYLDASTTLENDIAADQAAVASNSSLNLTDLEKLSGAMRISILTSDSYYIIDPHKDGITYQAGRLNVADSDIYYDTYSLGFMDGSYTGKEALYGEYTGFDSIVWDKALTADSSLADPSSNATAFNAVSKAGVQPLDIEASLADGVEFKAEDSINLEDFAYSADRSDNIVLAALEPGETKRIVISYYIEGWDKDSVEDIQYASFISYLKLKGVYDYSYLTD